KNAEGGMAHAVALTTDLIDAVAIISKVVQVDTKPDPLKIAAPQDGNWFHRQLGDKGSFFKNDEKPLLKIKDPVVGNQTAKGADRLVFDLQIPVRPQGRLYVFEYKRATTRQLIMVWHTAHMDFSKPRTAGSGSSIPYHLYYHPTPRDTTPYPYGKNKEGDEPHVSLGYRHTMFE